MSDNYYSGELDHDGDKIKILDLKGYRRINPDYKKKFISAFMEYYQEDFEKAIKDLDSDKELSFEEKRSTIIDSFYFNTIISISDFITSFPISKTISYYFFKYNILVTNIIYSKEKNETYTKWKSLYKSIKVFDWKEQNYFAIK